MSGLELSQPAAGLAALVSLAVLGGLHCAGMCGGLALVAFGRSEHKARDAWAYAAGKAFSYALLGALAGAAANALLRAAQSSGLAQEQLHSFGGWLRAGLALLSALLLGWVGWNALGLRWKLPGSEWAAAASGPLAWLWRELGKLGPSGRALGLGLANGLVPCGLSMGAIGASLALPPLWAALGLFAFGIATLPALWLSSALLQRVGGARLWGARALGVCLCALALLTLWRGIAPLWAGAAGAPCPGCALDAPSPRAP